MVSDIPAGDGKIDIFFFTVYLRGWARVRHWPPAAWSSRSRCGSRGTRSRRRSAAAPPAGSTADDGGPPAAPSPPTFGVMSGFAPEPDGLKLQSTHKMATPIHFIYHHARTKLQCTLQLRGEIHPLYFISTQYVLYVLCG